VAVNVVDAVTTIDVDVTEDTIRLLTVTTPDEVQTETVSPATKPWPIASGIVVLVPALVTRPAGALNLAILPSSL
jgi:hypothetical protein